MIFYPHNNDTIYGFVKKISVIKYKQYGFTSEKSR